MPRSIAKTANCPWLFSVSWHLDDFPAFEFILGLNRGLANLSDMEEIWREEWECAAEHEPDLSSQSHCTRR